MSLNLSMKPGATQARGQSRSFKRGEDIHIVGEVGQAWRVVCGAVRLDALGPEGAMFANLAVGGDVIGAEALVSGHYAFTARAITPCTLVPWSAPKTSLLGVLAASQRRAADVIALRYGRAADRLARLMRLLQSVPDTSPPGLPPVLPRLRDIADITDLTIETVSRVASALGQAPGMARPGRRRTPAPALLAGAMAAA